VLILKSKHEEKLKALENELFFLKNELRLINDQSELTIKNIYASSDTAFLEGQRTLFFNDNNNDRYISHFRESKVNHFDTTNDYYTLTAHNLKYARSSINHRKPLLHAEVKRDYVTQEVDYVYIQDVQIAEPDRNLGIGSFFIETLKLICKKRNHLTIQGDLASGDISDHKERLFHFYKANGFEIIKKHSGEWKVVCELEPLSKEKRWDF